MGLSALAFVYREELIGKIDLLIIFSKKHTDFLTITPCKRK